MTKQTKRGIQLRPYADGDHAKLQAILDEIPGCDPTTLMKGAIRHAIVEAMPLMTEKQRKIALETLDKIAEKKKTTNPLPPLEEI